MKKLILLIVLLFSCTNPVGKSEQDLKIEYEVEYFNIQDYPEISYEYLNCNEVYYKDCPMLLCKWEESRHLCVSLESTGSCEKEYFKGYCVSKEIITENF